MVERGIGESARRDTEDETRTPNRETRTANPNGET